MLGQLAALLEGWCCCGTSLISGCGEGKPDGAHTVCALLGRLLAHGHQELMSAGLSGIVPGVAGVDLTALVQRATGDAAWDVRQPVADFWTADEHLQVWLE